MTDERIIRLMREYHEGLFPKVCPNCGRVFATLREYLLATERVGKAVSYDAELGDWEPTRPIGGMSAANCSCGTTLALTTETMPLSLSHLMLRWIKAETARRGLSRPELLEYLRDEVRKQVLAEEPVEELANGRLHGSR